MKHVPESEAIKGYWFSETNALSHGDGRTVALGETHSVEGEIEACKHGLHSTINALDALKYAPGDTLWIVESWGAIDDSESDKLCASHRRYIAGGIDISETLREFARWCALQVYDKIAQYDTNGVIKLWLETGDEKYREAAYATADSAAYLAAHSITYAARSAARSAYSANWASSAAYSAYSAASSAYSTARSAAGSIARKVQNEKLEAMIESALDKVDKK
jgi:hypothetical protein